MLINITPYSNLWTLLFVNSYYEFVKLCTFNLGKGRKCLASN